MNKEVEYCFEIKNNSFQKRRVVLFGLMDHQASKNFGSGSGIVISELKHKEEYMKILYKSMSHPFITTSIKACRYNDETTIFCNEDPQMAQRIKYTIVDAIGKPEKIYISMKRIENINIRMDGHSQMAFTLLPNYKIYLFIKGKTI